MKRTIADSNSIDTEGLLLPAMQCPIRHSCHAGDRAFENEHLSTKTCAIDLTLQLVSLVRVCCSLVR